MNDGFQVLHRSLASEAKLHRRGRAVARRLVGEAESEEPRHAFGTRWLGPDPLFIVGLPRSGTTALHQELSTETGHFLSLPSLYWQGPAECSEFVRGTGWNPDWALVWHVPSYLRWCLEQDPLKFYHVHRAVLAGSTVATRRLLLKWPTHLLGLEALMEVYPGARFVWLARDRKEVTRSLRRLTEATRRLSSNHVTRRDTWGFCDKILGRLWIRGHDVLQRHPDRFLVVASGALRQNPEGVRRQVVEFAGR